MLEHIAKRHFMRFGSSPQGKVALVHFSLLVASFAVQVGFMPVRPSEGTPLQFMVFNAAGSIVIILAFPLGLIPWLIPEFPSDLLMDMRVLLAPAFILLNSCLWGYGIVWLSRRLGWWPNRSDQVFTDEQ